MCFPCCSGPAPPGRCSGPPVCTLCVWCCVYGVLVLLAPVHRRARPVFGVACTASWLLVSGVHALCVVLRVRCSGPLPTPTHNGQYVPGHSAGGPRHTHPAKQVQRSRHLPAQCRIPHPWTAPTRTPTRTHPGGQTVADGRRGKKGHQRALAHITVQPTAHLPQDFGTERHIVLKGQAHHIITTALYTLAAHEHHWDPTTILAMPPPPQGPKEPASPLQINQLLRRRATPYLHPS